MRSAALTRGWTTFLTYSSDARRAKERLAHAAGRLFHKHAARAFDHWATVVDRARVQRAINLTLRQMGAVKLQQGWRCWRLALLFHFATTPLPPFAVALFFLPF